MFIFIVSESLLSGSKEKKSFIRNKTFISTIIYVNRDFEVEVKSSQTKRKCYTAHIKALLWFPATHSTFCDIMHIHFIILILTNHNNLYFSPSNVTHKIILILSWYLILISFFYSCLSFKNIVSLQSNIVQHQNLDLQDLTVFESN